MASSPHNPAVSFYKKLIVSRQVAVAVFAENCNPHYERALLSMQLHMPLAPALQDKNIAAHLYVM